MQQNFLMPKLKNLRENATVRFEIDGATAHTAKKSMNVLRGLFPAHLTSLHGNIGWPTHSPDLSPHDYFLWGYVKVEEDKHQPAFIDGLKAAICKTINEIPQ